MCIEFIGIVIFSVLQVSVLKVVDMKSTFTDYIIKKDENLLMWLMMLEKSTFPEQMPSDLHEIVKQQLHNSFRLDLNTIIEEADFYFKLSPLMQR